MQADLKPQQKMAITKKEKEESRQSDTSHPVRERVPHEPTSLGLKQKGSERQSHYVRVRTGRQSKRTAVVDGWTRQPSPQTKLGEDLIQGTNLDLRQMQEQLSSVWLFLQSFFSLLTMLLMRHTLNNLADIETPKFH